MTRDFNADYSQVAWCTDISPNGFEYFKELKDSGVDAAIVALRVSGDISDNHSMNRFRLLETPECLSTLVSSLILSTQKTTLMS